MNLETYLALRARVLDFDPAAFTRTQAIVPPANATDLALSVAYVILNGGMSWRVADGIWARLEPRLREAGTVGDTFGHPGKRAAIDSIMLNCAQHFAEFERARAEGADAVIAFCAALPFIGAVTKFHLAKNLGVDVAKPDVWLVRVAKAANESVETLCQRLSEASGDRVAVIDLVVWRACERGWWLIE